MSQFNIEKYYLQQKLFDPVKPRSGAKTNLNITVLPDYMAYIKSQLTRQEHLTLSDYHLQNLLMQYSTGVLNLLGDQNSNILLDSIDTLTMAILAYIRRRKQFWLKKANVTDQKEQQHHASEKYSQHINAVNKHYFPQDVYNRYMSYNYQSKKKIENEYIFHKIFTMQKNQNKIIANGFTYFIEYVLDQKNITKRIKIRQEEQQQQDQSMEIQNKQKQINDNNENQQKNKNNDNSIIQENESQQQKINVEIVEENPIISKQQLINNNINQNNIQHNKIQQQVIQEQKKPHTIKCHQPIDIQYDIIDPEQRQKIKHTLQQAIMHFALINKSKIKPYISQQQKNLKIQSQNSQGDNHFQKLEKWIQYQKDINVKSVISSKQWYFNHNIIEILIKIKNNILLGINNEQIYTLNYQPQLDIQRIILSDKQISILANSYLNKYHKYLEEHFRIAHLQQNISKPFITDKQEPLYRQGYKISVQEINLIKQQFQEIINHPHNTKLTKYKVMGAQIPWQDQYYKNFLSSLSDMLYLPTNNRKIAQRMSQQLKTKIQPNHVKYVKGIYFRNMTKRMESGQCGGGKRGRCLSKDDFVKKDMELYNMKYFRQTQKKGLKKKKKSRRKNSSEDEVGQSPIAQIQ